MPAKACFFACGDSIIAWNAVSTKQERSMSLLIDGEVFLKEDDKDMHMPSWYETASRILPKTGEPVRGFTPTGDFFDSTIKSSRMGPKDVPIIITEDGQETDVSLLRTSLPRWPTRKKKEKCEIRYSYCGRLWDGEADVAEGDSIVEVSHKDPMAGLPFVVRIPVANVMFVRPK